MISTAILLAAAVSAVIAVLVAWRLRLPWWATLLAAVVAWFGLGLQLALVESLEGELHWMSAKLAVLPTFAGGLYAVVTRGVLGPPHGPVPRSH